MHKVIVVTGTPGTGKTTVAMRLAKKAKWKYVDVNKVISLQKLSEGYDRKKKCRIVDVKKLSKVLVKMYGTEGSVDPDGVVIDSHLAHHMPASAVDVCVVTKCNLKLLKRRLKKRKYSEAKIADNIECEIFDECANEAAEKGHPCLMVETDKKVDYDMLLRKIKRMKKRK